MALRQTILGSSGYESVMLGLCDVIYLEQLALLERRRRGAECPEQRRQRLDGLGLGLGL